MKIRHLLATALILTPLAPSLAPSVARAQDAEPTVEELVVQATRSGRRVQDEPIRVEVLDREEIEEKVAMRPGDIAMLLSETAGLRVQVTSPALGASNIRIQGMRGRYTQFLSDGLPLQGGQAASIGLLQIAPTDLGQVEVIKGAASALYGPSALGGVINLVSRRPHDAPEGEAILNLTSHQAQDFTQYVAAPLGDGWSGSLTSGVHRQGRQDLNGDGWADLPGFSRWTLRPRLFWTGDGGADAYLTLGAMGERRTGGTVSGRLAPDGAPFAQNQKTRRLDGGAVISAPLSDLGKLQLRLAGVTQDHDHRFGALLERDRHDTLFAEVSISGRSQATTWLAGAAAQRDAYRNKAFPAFDYAYEVPAVFAQVEHDVTPDLTLAGSVRYDDHSRYGGRVSPRVSVLFKPGPWTVRATAGQGFYAPTPFVEETEAAGLSRLEPLSGLRAETARSAAMDVGFARGPFEANLTLFGSDIRDAVRATPVGPARIRLANIDGDTRTRGAEALLRYRWDEITLTGSYVYTDATEPDIAGGRRTVPFTPRHAASLVAVWEREDWGRVGFEAYYTGRQELEDDPSRTRSRPYVELGAMVERRLGRLSLFLNLENLLDVRQSDTAPMLRPSRAPDGSWTVDAWGPTEGFVANAGVRIRFG